MSATIDSPGAEDEQIAAAIGEVEQATSGEIRVFISRHSPSDPAHEAQRQFAVLGMDRTPLRNGVLLYFAPANHGFAIVADEAVRFRTGDKFVPEITAAMMPAWQQRHTLEAILKAIQAAGVLLARHFPRSRLDRDDLANQVVRD
jgi:uncharacterized membrane protein